MSVLTVLKPARLLFLIKEVAIKRVAGRLDNGDTIVSATACLRQLDKLHLRSL